MQYVKTFSPPRVKDELINRGLVGLNDEINKIARTINLSHGIDPREYGAKFDGVTDDARSIQATFDRAISRDEEVSFPYKRTAMIGSRLYIDSNLFLNGNRSTLERMDTFYSSHAMITGPTPISNVTIRNLRLNSHHKANAALMGAINFGETEDAVVSDINVEYCDFIDCYYGVYVSGVAGEKGPVASRVNMRYCTMTGGDYLANGGTEDMTALSRWMFMLNVQAEDCTMEGCYAENLQTLFQVISYDSTGYDGYVYAHDCKVLDNYARNLSSSGIYLFGWNHLISGNTVIGAGKEGITVNVRFDPDTDECYSHDCKIADNHVEGVGRIKADGGPMIIVGGDNHIISNNTCIGVEPGASSCTSQWGFKLLYTNNVTVEGNTVRTSGAFADTSGFLFNSANDFINDTTISDNTFIGMSVGIPLSEDVNGMVISNNKFIDTDGTTGRVIQATTFGEDVVITGNLFKNFKRDAIYLWNPDSHSKPLFWVISDNTFRGDTANSKHLAFRGVGRIAMNGNVYKGTRDYDRYFEIGASPMFGDGNISDYFEAGSSMYATTGNHAETFLEAVPPSDDSQKRGALWFVGEVAWRRDPQAGESPGWVCIAEGTVGLLNSSSTTGDMTNGSDQLTDLSSMAGIYVGQFITVDGSGAAGANKDYRIIAIDVDNDSATLDADAETTVDDAAVSYTNPTFKELANIEV